MTPISWRLLTFSLALLLTVGFGAQAHGAEKLIPKVDNFLILFDSSGSMGYDFEDTDTSKAEMAKQALTNMNQEIPELGYDSALFAVVPFEKVQGWEEYDTEAYAKALDQLPVEQTDWGFFGYPTPLGEAILNTNDALLREAGDTAYIVVSDGKTNKGVDAYAAASNVYEANDGDVCFHVISYADTDKGKKTMQKIASLSDCSVMIMGADMMDDAAMKQFVEDVFYSTEMVEEKPEPAPTVVPEAKTVRKEVVILYEFDKSVVRPMFFDEIKAVSEFVKRTDDSEVYIEGHTCNIGTDTYNLGLSQRRAEAARDALVERESVSPEIIKLYWYGESRPAFSNATKEGRQKNRRAVISVTGVE
jgi:OOP family OmpA-OmpF porin